MLSVCKLICKLNTYAETQTRTCVYRTRALILLCDNLLCSLIAMLCLRIRGNGIFIQTFLLSSPQSVCHSLSLARFPSLLFHPPPIPNPLPLLLSDVCTQKTTKSVPPSFLPHYFVISQSNNFAFPQRDIHGSALHMPGHEERKEKEREYLKKEGKRVAWLQVGACGEEESLFMMAGRASKSLPSRRK